MFEEGPDRFVQWYVSQWTDLTEKVLGFDMMEFMDQVITRLVKEEFTKQFPQRPPEIDEAAAQKLLPKFQKLTEPSLSVQRLRGQTLLEQAVVLGVTAYETYVTDSAGAILRLNPKLAERFTPELKKGLGWERIRKHGRNLKEAVTALILEEHSALQTDRVGTLFARLVPFLRTLSWGLSSAFLH